MSRWNVKSSTLWILGIVVVFMLAIVILPDVDLPDTAFHRGSAPVVVHSRANSAPPAVVASLEQQNSSSSYAWGTNRHRELGAVPDSNFRPILLRTIRC